MESYSGVPVDRVYRVDYEGGKGEYVEEVCLKFFRSKDLDAQRWLYCWAGSPLHHCQICIQDLVYNIYPAFQGRWGCRELWMDEDAAVAVEVKLLVPSKKINWDRILAVSVDKKMITFKILLWGILRETKKYRNIPKPCPDCVSTAKEILGTMGIYCSGETPVEFYESLVKNYKHEEKRYRRFL